MRYARFQSITTYETIDLLSMAVADGDVTDEQAYEVMVHMSERGRLLRLPGSASELSR